MPHFKLSLDRTIQYMYICKKAFFHIPFHVVTQLSSICRLSMMNRRQWETPSSIHSIHQHLVDWGLGWAIIMTPCRVIYDRRYNTSLYIWVTFNFICTQKMLCVLDKNYNRNYRQAAEKKNLKKKIYFEENYEEENFPVFWRKIIVDIIFVVFGMFYILSYRKTSRSYRTKVSFCKKNLLPRHLHFIAAARNHSSFSFAYNLALNVTTRSQLFHNSIVQGMSKEYL